MPDECDWKQYEYSSNTWKPSCTPRAFTIAASYNATKAGLGDFGYKFCPNCGKPINCLPEWWEPPKYDPWLE